MDDRMLDETLELWKRRRTPKKGEFADAAEFERNFFAKVALEDARAALWSRRWKVLRRLAACLAILAAGVAGALAVMHRTSLMEKCAAPGEIARAPSEAPSGHLQSEAPPVERDELRSAEELRDAEAPQAAQEKRLSEVESGEAAREPLDRAEKGKVRSAYGYADYGQTVGVAISATAYSYNAVDMYAVYSKAEAAERRVRAAAAEDPPFVATSSHPRAISGVGISTSGYAMVRRMILEEGRLPAAEEVRIEELVNAFHYDYPPPSEGEALRPHFEMGAAPWDPSHRLLLVGVQARGVREVAFQLEFRPEKVAAYRLLGGGLRTMTDAGQQVTALYEIVPADATAKADGEWLALRMLWRPPQGDVIEKSIVLKDIAKAGANWEWASAVAEFGLCLRNSKYAPKASLAQVIQRAQKALGKDADGARAEFLRMVHRAQELRGK